MYGLLTPNDGAWMLRLFSCKRQVEVVPETRTPDTLTLMFIGDVMSHTPQVTAAQIYDGYYDYSTCYRYLAPSHVRGHIFHARSYSFQVYSLQLLHCPPRMCLRASAGTSAQGSNE